MIDSGSIEGILSILRSLILVSLEGDLRDEVVDLAHPFHLLAPADVAAKGVGALLVICTGRRVRHTKRAVNTATVPQLDMIVGRLAVLVVAPVTEVVRAETVPKGNIAAVHALPVDGG